MDRSRLTLSSLDELGQIRADVRLCNSLDMVRASFERLQEIRRQHLDDFDLQIALADAQQEIIERARYLRRQTEAASAAGPASTVAPLKPEPAAIPIPLVKEDPESAEIPEDVPKLEKKSWHLAVGLAVLFTVCILAAFFYLIQTARRLNFVDEANTPKTAAPLTTAPPVAKAVPTSDEQPPALDLSPSLRLYTDLTAGTVAVDDEPARDLGDGELNLDSLVIGTHNVRVDSRGGGADFSFALDGEKDVPRVTQISKANNAMVVLVSVKDGTGRLNTDATGANVLLDGKPVGAVGDDGLLLLDLGKSDHELEVSQGQHDKQKFVLTYTSAPTLTVFVKSDPSTGVLTVSAGQDAVSVFINDLPYKRLTDHGSVRIPLKVGTYRVRVHRIGFKDPPEQTVSVKKSAEAAVQFHLQILPELGTLEIKGAQPGTVAFVDHQPAATVGQDGTAKVANIKPGVHPLELSHDQAITKQLTRLFTAGQTTTIEGADAVLDHYAADNKSVIPAAPGPPMIAPPQVPQLLPAALPATTGEQVHKGGGFVPYHTPRTPGHYFFQAHTKIGGVLKHGKLQWYAGYRDADNYVLFSLDGKHAEVKEVRDGKSVDVGKIPFELSSEQWVQVEMSVQPGGIQARAKAGPGDWTELTPVSTSRDATNASVGMYVPSNEELAVANFRFSSK